MELNKKKKYFISQKDIYTTARARPARSVRRAGGNSARVVNSNQVLAKSSPLHKSGVPLGAQTQVQTNFIYIYLMLSSQFMWDTHFLQTFIIFRW